MKQTKRWKIYIAVVAFLLCCLPGAEASSFLEGVDRVRLQNGLTVLLKELPQSRVSSVQIWVDTGSANETGPEAGITHFIEHMIFKGTPKRATGEIARTIESAGGSVNAYTSLDRTVYFAEIPAMETGTAVDVLLDALQFSLFEERELAREREVVLEEYRRSEDLPERQLSRELMALAFKKHPYGRPVIGTEESIRSFDREAVMDYIDKWYTPENMVVVVVGDFNADAILAQIKTLTRDFPQRRGHEPVRPVEPPQEETRSVVLHEDVGQAYMELAWRIPPFKDEDTPALDLLGTILGEGKVSRLNAELRMDRRMVNSISAGAYSLEDSGLFFVSSTLPADNVTQAVTVVGREVSRLRAEPVPASELRRALNQAEADFLFGMETASGQARTLGFFEMIGGGYERVDDYLNRLRSVTPAEIQRVANVYLRPQDLSMGLLVPSNASLGMSSQELGALFEARTDEGGGEKESAEAAGRVIMKTFANGVRVIVEENPDLPLFSVVGAFMGGSRLEPAEKAGLSRFAANMLTRGTETRSAKEIASTVEGWAGRLEGFSGRNSIGLSGRFLSKDLYPALLLFSDVLLRPSFPEEEMGKVRSDMLEAISAKKDRPTAQLFDLFYATLYRDHPYGRPETGTEESVAGIQRGDLERWYGGVAFPSGFVLSVVGDVNASELLPFLETMFSAFPKGRGSLPAVEAEPPLGAPRSSHLQRPGAQTHIAVGYLGVSMLDPANAPMALVDTVLSGMGGRLFQELREKESLAYTVTAFRRPGLETGLFAVYLACDPGKTDRARELVFRELNRLKEEGVSGDELAAAKRYLLGQMAINQQSNGSQAMQMALDELYGLGYDHRRRYRKAIEAVEPGQVSEAARQVFRPDSYVIVSVGPEPAVPANGG